MTNKTVEKNTALCRLDHSSRPVREVASTKLSGRLSATIMAALIWMWKGWRVRGKVRWSSHKAEDEQNLGRYNAS
jgi:hypothetical protein